MRNLLSWSSSEGLRVRERDAEREEAGGWDESERERITNTLSMCCTYPHTYPRGEVNISTQTRMFFWERLHVSLRSGIKRRKDPFGSFGWGRRRGWGFAAQPSRSLVEKIGVEALSNSSKAAVDQQ
jgi:hypothetical protein